VKAALDRVIGLSFGEPDLEFFWVGDDAIDPLEQAQTIAILLGAGIKTVAEARAELGLGQTKGVVKFNPYHDEAGRFTDAAHAVEPGADEAQNKPDHSLIQPAADRSRTYTVDLADEERRGGHTVTRHVGRTDESLKAEAAIPVRQTLFQDFYRAAGSFPTLSDANSFVNRVLEGSPAVVDSVASGAVDEAWLESRFGYPTGKEAIVSDDSGVPTIRPIYSVGVYIVHDSFNPTGYTVRTAYPLNNNPGAIRL